MRRYPRPIGNVTCFALVPVRTRINTVSAPGTTDIGLEDSPFTA
jgi:hypothetical protein